MPKRLDPTERTFQPIEARILREIFESEEQGSEAAPAAPPIIVKPEERSAPATPTERLAKPVARARQEPAPLPARPTDQETLAETRAARASEREQRPAVKFDRLNRPVKVHLDPEDFLEFNRILNQLTMETGTPVSASHLLRAFLTVLRHAEDEVMQRARQQAPFRRPPNDNRAAIAAFEYRLAKVLSGAFRQAPPIRE